MSDEKIVIQMAMARGFLSDAMKNGRVIAIGRLIEWIKKNDQIFYGEYSDRLEKLETID